MSHYDDFGGEYDMITYEWLAGNDIIFQTKFKTYTDGKAISFIQSYPNGLIGTNLINASAVVSNCNQDTESPFLSFPSFNVVNKNNLYAQNELGYLTWKDQQIQNSYGRVPIKSSIFAGINGGVMILFNNRSTNDIQNNIAVVVSSVNHFSSFAQMNNIPSAIPVINMHKNDINDYVTCIGYECQVEKLQNGYDIINELDGIAMSAIISSTSALDQIIPLHLWYSKTRNDHYISSKLNPLHSSYEMISETVGYIYKYDDKISSRLPFEMYYNEQLKDYTMVGSNEMKQRLINNGYKLLWIEGYIKNKSYFAEVNTDWKLGTTATVLDIPHGYEHEIAIVVGNGINDAMMNEWSKRLQSLYHTSKLSSKYDLTTSYLSYWTDHGAYYYGDSYPGEGSMNLSCCSLDKLKDTKQKLDAQGVPVQYIQMDDWWYAGRRPQQIGKGGWGGVKGVSHWQPPEQYYPGQLAGLTKALEIPLLLYGPYFDPDNDWNGQFTFTPLDSGYVLPTPEDSYGFYSALFEFGINATTIPGDINTGFIGYEIDFMNCLSHTPLFRLHVDQQEQWLYGIDKAAKEKGLIVQYCMTTPMNLLIALSLSQTTNARGSQDYASNHNWNIGPSSLLTQSLAIKISKDNFWTMFDEPIPPHYGKSGPDYNSTEIHALAATLSAGVVGISDGAGYTNKTLIMRSCTSTGRLLQPSRAATSIDDQFVYESFNKNSFNVWGAPFGPKNVNNLWNIVYAVDMEKSYDLSVNSLYPRLNGNFMYIVRNWHNYTNCKNNTMAIQNHCIVMGNQKKDGFLYTLNPQPIISPMLHSFELITISLASFDQLVFVGELDKYISASENRFDNLIIEEMSLSVDINGGANETVYITILQPNSNKNDWIVLTYDVVLPKLGYFQFRVSL
eukprot:237573_1